MRALITGYGGFAGGHLAQHLSNTTDWELWGTTFQPEESEHAASVVRAVTVDLRNPEATRQLFLSAQPDMVFHLAGQASVREAWTDPWATFETNLRLQLNVLEAAAAVSPRARIVAVTSNEVYGRPDPEHIPTGEDAPLRPLNPYATSKAAQDLLVEQYVASHGLNAVRVRPFTHIGPRQDSRFVASNFAMQVAEIEVGAREPVIAVGDLSPERDFTDVRDIVAGYHAAAEKGIAGSVYNLGSGRAHAISEIVEYYQSRARTPIEIATDRERLRPTEIPRTLCDPRLAAAQLGWEAKIPFESTLQDVLDYWRARV